MVQSFANLKHPIVSDPILSLPDLETVSDLILMILNDPISSSGYCWVYIARECGSTLQFYIGAAVDFPQLLNDNEQKELLYYRQFPNVLDGLAHKLLLAEMNHKSINQLIRGMNPEMRDLNKDFKTNNIR